MVWKRFDLEIDNLKIDPRQASKQVIAKKIGKIVERPNLVEKACMFVHFCYIGLDGQE